MRRVWLLTTTLVLGAGLGAVHGSPALGAASPNPAFTPGATDPVVAQTTISSTICKRRYTKSVRNVTGDTAKLVFAEYGIPGSAERGYVIDHLVPLELGGSNDLKNLWPQPKNESKAKDKLESQMHARVCKGSITLAAAQAAFAILSVPVAPSIAPATAPPPTQPPPTVPPETQPPVVLSPQVVHPGAFCAPVGATGVTVAGTPMVCGPASDGRNRWHSQ